MTTFYVMEISFPNFDSDRIEEIANGINDELRHAMVQPTPSHGFGFDLEITTSNRMEVSKVKQYLKIHKIPHKVRMDDFREQF